MVGIIITGGFLGKHTRVAHDSDLPPGSVPIPHLNVLICYKHGHLSHHPIIAQLSIECDCEVATRTHVGR